MNQPLRSIRLSIEVEEFYVELGELGFFEAKDGAFAVALCEGSEAR